MNGKSWRCGIGSLLLVALLCAMTSYAARAQSGYVWGWGDNENGQLGNGTNVSRVKPGPSIYLSGATMLSAGWLHGIALSNGEIFGWGDDRYLQGSVGGSSTSLYPVATGFGAKQIAAGAFHNVALGTNGSVSAWGDNLYGELGDGTAFTAFYPVAPLDGSGNAFFPVASGTDAPPPPATGAAPDPAAGVAAGAWHTIIVTDFGYVYNWGDNSQGQLGATPDTKGNIPGFSDIPIEPKDAKGANFFPIPVPTGAPTGTSPDVAVAVAAGDGFSLALTAKGNVYVWGAGSSTPSFYYSGVAAIAAGGDTLTIKLNTGAILSSFYGPNGQPSNVIGLPTVKSFSCGNNGGMAVGTDGSVWTWDSSLIASKVLGVSGALAGAVGYDFDLASANWGTVWAPYDLDGDGYNDLLFSGTLDGTLNYWLMQDTVTLVQSTTPIATASSPDWNVVAEPDINGDGNPDLIWQNRQTGDVTYWILDGTSYTGVWDYVVRGISPQWQVVASADMDGDGYPDLIYQNTLTGDVTYLQVVNGAYTGTWGYLAQGVPPVWHVVAASDLTGDGRADLVWWNSQTGDVTYYKMNYTTYTGTWGYIAHQVPTNWSLVGLADFTGDGYPDLIWQNPSTGDVNYYELRNVLGVPTWTGLWGNIAKPGPGMSLVGLR